MRVLFRGKAQFDGYGYKEGDWFFGNLIEEIRPDYYINPKTNGRKIAVCMETVSQYTGLKDCNGNDIFEGDILEEAVPEIKEAPARAICLYDYEECRYWPFFATGESMSPEDFFHNDMVKVIGNIWDNKELYHQIEEQHQEEYYQEMKELHGDLESL
ncbi:hypothetical protein E0L01_09240 [Megamonas funiformis]|uniref:YopX family protein n=1 Tax=Megamonas funiformis TaxID=437897 RepID=UPI001431EAD4|nr:YopX family protein [Megamonas funiformis]NJE28955.1 hypothetical protein [Megamonas funiformis]